MSAWGTNSVTCNCLIDTGACYTVIEKGLWEQLNTDVLPLPMPKLQGAGGEALKVCGVTRIYFLSLLKEFPCVIVEGLKHDLIIGLDILKPGQAKIDLKARRLTLFDTTYNLRLTRLPIGQVTTLTEEYANYFPGLFATEQNPVGYCDLLPMRVHTEGPPVKQKAYRVPLSKRIIIEGEIHKMLEAGVIKPSTSEYASPVVLVRKGDGTYRFCISYIELNKTIKDCSYPLPSIRFILDSLAGSVIFSTIDCSSAFWSVIVDSRDTHKLAFTTHLGLYESLRSPYGLKTSPTHFQRLMNLILAPYIGKFAQVYIDDVIIYSKRVQDHPDHVKVVLKAIAFAGLKLKEKKCKFHQKEVLILGFIVSAEGIRPNPERVSAINDMPAPTNLKQVRSFLGSCNYYRSHVPGFANIASPLVALTRKNVPFNFGPEQMEAFNELKRQLMSPRVMAHPTVGREYEIFVDASNKALGGILAQRDDEGRLKVIHYMSKMLSGPQTRYSTIEKEALAVLVALKTFRPYVFGEKILLRSDHKPLAALFKKNIQNSRVLAWQIAIADYDVRVAYIKGKENVTADHLRRIEWDNGGTSVVESGPLINGPFGSQLDVRGEGTPLMDASEMAEAGCSYVATILLINLGTPGFERILDFVKEVPVQCFSVRPRERPGMVCEETMGVVRPSRRPKMVFGGTISVIGLTHAEKEILERRLAVDNIRKRHLAAMQQKEYAVEWKLAQEDNKSSPEWVLIEGLLFRLSRGSKREKFVCRLVLPEQGGFRKKIIQNAHGQLAHMSTLKTYLKIADYYYFENMRRYIEAYLKQCPECSLNKAAPYTTAMGEMQAVDKAFNFVALDLIGPLEKSHHNNTYCLVVVCYLTRFIDAEPIPDKSALSVCAAFGNITCRLGMPATILSDRGREFNNKLLATFCNQSGIKHKFTAPYSPKSNGLVERYNASLKSGITHLVGNNPANWEKVLPRVLLAIRLAEAVHGFSPFYLMFGRDYMLQATPTHTTSGEPLCLWLEQLQEAREYAMKNIVESRRYNRKRLAKSNVPNFKPGDRVLLKAEPQRLTFTSKYDPTPYKIKRLYGSAVIVENQRKKRRVVNKCHLKLAPALGKLAKIKRPRRKVVKRNN